jgi:hypothetical protein
MGKGGDMTEVHSSAVLSCVVVRYTTYVDYLRLAGLRFDFTRLKSSRYEAEWPHAAPFTQPRLSSYLTRARWDAYRKGP